MQVAAGWNAYVDNVVAINAGRFNASLQDEEAASPGSPWADVASAVQAVLRHPQTPDERTSVRHVDPLMFTPALCQHRARYLLWRAERSRRAEAEAAAADGGAATAAARVKRPAPSGFNILQHSLERDVKAIMDDARARLPSTLTPSGAMGAAGNGNDGNDEDDDDDGPIEVYTHPDPRTDDEIALDVQRAEDEDDLLQAVQRLQLAHFKKHKRWVEVPWLDDSAGAALVAANASVASAKKAATAAEEKSADARRTIRPGADAKKEKEAAAAAAAAAASAAAASERPQRPPSPDALQSRRLFDAARAPSAQLHKKQRALGVYERRAIETAAVRQPERTQAVEAGVRSGDLAALKRALHPGRPARPSEQGYDDEAAYMEEYGVDDGDDDAYEETEAAAVLAGERFLAAVRGESSSSSAAAAACAAAPSAESSPSKSERPPAKAATAAKASAAPVPAAPGRNRWAIQEYSDDDDNDDDDDE